MSSKKPGRPPKYNSDLHPSLAEAWAATGKTDIEIAEKLSVHVDTINDWKKTHPEFSDSLKAGKAIPDEQVEKSLFQRALGFSHPSEEIFCKDGDVVRVPTIKQYPPDTTACIFWLKNRRSDKWRDKHEFEDVTPTSTPLQVAERLKKLEADERRLLEGGK